MSDNTTKPALSRKPIYGYPTSKKTIGSILADIAAGKHVYYSRLQRKYEAWTMDEKREFLIDSINGINPGIP